VGVAGVDQGRYEVVKLAAIVQHIHNLLLLLLFLLLLSFCQVSSLDQDCLAAPGVQVCCCCFHVFNAADGAASTCAGTTTVVDTGRQAGRQIHKKKSSQVRVGLLLLLPCLQRS
jgi:hypothetical protein